MSSSTGSTTRRPEVQRAAVITHGQAETVKEPLERLRALAQERSVELVLPEDEVAKHGDGAGAAGDVTSADLAVVLGGDGTMLRALKTFLGTEVPVFGVNFGRVGFLASARAEELEAGVGRAFAGTSRSSSFRRWRLRRAAETGRRSTTSSSRARRSAG